MNSMDLSDRPTVDGLRYLLTHFRELTKSFLSIFSRGCFVIRCQRRLVSGPLAVFALVSVLKFENVEGSEKEEFSNYTGLYPKIY